MILTFVDSSCIYDREIRVTARGSVTVSFDADATNDQQWEFGEVLKYEDVRLAMPDSEHHFPLEQAEAERLTKYGILDSVWQLIEIKEDEPWK